MNWIVLFGVYALSVLIMFLYVRDNGYWCWESYAMIFYPFANTVLAILVLSSLIVELFHSATMKVSYKS